MLKQLLFVVFTFSGVVMTGLADGAPGGDPAHEGERALRLYYKDRGEIHFNAEYEINGVRVVSAVVNSPAGQAEGSATAEGAFITTGIPWTFETLSPGARATAELFKVPTKSLTLEEVHGWFVSLSGPDKKPYVVEMDATGRIRSIKSPEQLFEDAPTREDRVSGPVGHQIREMIAKRFAGYQVMGVDIAIHDPGCYLVGIRGPKGTGWLITTPTNDITEWRFPSTREDLPEAVRRAIARDLRGDRIQKVEQGATRFYKVNQDIGGEPVVMLIKPNGAVEWMSSRELHHHFEGRH